MRQEGLLKLEGSKGKDENENGQETPGSSELGEGLSQRRKREEEEPDPPSLRGPGPGWERLKGKGF
jgi:hypothetical protein